MAVTQLDATKRDRVWVSTLTGAQYRWGAQQWVVRFDKAPDWHPVKPYFKVQTVYSQAGERFEEVVAE